MAAPDMVSDVLPSLLIVDSSEPLGQRPRGWRSLIERVILRSQGDKISYPSPGFFCKLLDLFIVPLHQFSSIFLRQAPERRTWRAWCLPAHSLSLSVERRQRASCVPVPLPAQ